MLSARGVGDDIFVDEPSLARGLLYFEAGHHASTSLTMSADCAYITKP